MKRSQARTERLAAALRENLKRRKARTRALARAKRNRQHTGAAEEPSPCPDAETKPHQEK
jgi:hypothetical protein